MYNMSAALSVAILRAEAQALDERLCDRLIFQRECEGRKSTLRWEDGSKDRASPHISLPVCG